LGTEFGVEVAANGDTTSHVFQGTVVVQAGIREFGESGSRDLEKRPAIAVVGEGRTIHLNAGESARVQKCSNTGDARIMTGERPGAPPKFVRRIYQPPKLLDLLDIVAGGDGRGNRRERGIDPATGKQDTYFVRRQRRSDCCYHPVAWSRLIDGVFIPDGRTEPVQLDSADHRFGDFGELTLGMTIGPIWSRAAEISPINSKRHSHTYIYSMGRGDEFMPEGRGLLGLHSNVGITFDLQAIRQMHEGARPARFRSISGIADATLAYDEPYGKADVWVFVDGRLKWRRRLSHGESPVGAEVELGPSDHFLTLMSTNAGNGSTCDWVVLGEPVLVMTPTDAESVEKDNRKSANAGQKEGPLLKH